MEVLFYAVFFIGCALYLHHILKEFHKILKIRKEINEECQKTLLLNKENIRLAQEEYATQLQIYLKLKQNEEMFEKQMKNYVDISLDKKSGIN